MRVSRRSNMPEGVTSFASDIRRLFRDKDVESMKRAAGFDLSSHADVSARADGILERLEAGSMPCDGGWPAERVALFARWVTEGKQA
jgi:hypothetical protein